MLEQNVCDSCKWTKSDFEKYRAEHPNEDDELTEEYADMVTREISPLTFSAFFPDNYSELHDREKIDWLLSTACGCEFWYEEFENA